jgi:coenzyme F420 hydrogenase subunit beta
MVCPRLQREHTAYTSKESVIGGYTTMEAGRATDQTLREKSQDGGLVSGILKWGLMSKKWSSFVGYTRNEKWQVLPLIVTESSEVTKTCGSKYTYIPIVEGLSRLHESGLAKKPFAIVGLPCHIDAVRRLQESKSKYVKGLVLCIGLFCLKAFSHSGLVENKFIGDMGIPITDVRRMDIRKGLFTVEMGSGKYYQIPVKELQSYSHNGCSSCRDFSAEHADISAGGLGIEDWTIAVIRTVAGEEAMNAARSDGMIETGSADKFPKALQLMRKLSTWKHEQTV